MYYEKIALAIGVCVLAATVSAARRDWNTEFREPVHHVFNGDNALDVDNVNGLIEIVGDTGNTIRVEGEKIIRALDQKEVDRAKREVTLDINEKDGVAQLYVNGPFRENGHSSQDHGFHEHGDREYEVTYNFTIHVPRATGLQLRTVNGPVKTAQTDGKFDVRGVNGGITMTSLGGSGTVNGVNGPMTIAFRETPKTPSSFRTVNGKIEASFPPGLAADLSFKTMNGATYTDFDTAPLAAPTGTAERKDGRSVYRSNRPGTARIGAGGPELSFETVNGNITIHKEKK